MHLRLLSTAAALLVLTALLAPCAARADGPTIRGRLAEPLPADAGRAAVELLPLLDSHARALLQLGEAPAPATVARAQVQRDGSFVLAAPGLGPWHLRVEIPGHLPHERVLPPAFDLVDLEPVPLVPAGELAVTVVGPEGEPLAGARLSTVASRRSGWRAAAASDPYRATGEDGLIVVYRPLDGELTVGAWAPGLGASETLHVSGPAPVVLAVPAARPRLLELRDADGRPLAGAVIRFHPGAGDHAPWPAGVSGEDGRARAALPAGAETVWIDTGRGWDASMTLPDGCGAAETPCRLELPVPLELPGEVRDAVSSRLLGGALVWPGGRPDRVVSTDGRGRFVLRSPPGSPPRRIAATADGYAGAEVSRRPDDPPGPLLLALRPAMRIAGRVVDSDGAPLAGVRLRLLPNLGGFGYRPTVPPEEIETESGGDGAFRFPAVAAEAGRPLRAEMEGYAPAVVHPRPGEAGDLEIVLSAGGVVVGRLVGPGGEPVPGGRVRLQRMASDSADHLGGFGFDDDRVAADADAASGGDGRFSIRHLAAGRYLLFAEHPDHATLRLAGFEVPEGETVDLGTIEMKPGGRLAGRVVDPDGVPMEGAWLQAAANRGRPLMEDLLGPPAQTGEDGRFELQGLPVDEPLLLRVFHRGHPREEVAGIVLPLDEPLVVELRPGARVFGRVVGPRDEPIEGADVQGSLEIRLPHGSRHVGSGRATTAADGGFEIAGLGAGVLRLTARADAYPNGEVAGVEVGEDGEVGPIEIRLEAGGEVSGRVLAPDGSPAPGASVTVHTGKTPAELGIVRPSLLPHADGPIRTGTAFGMSDARGVFSIPGVALGPATVTAEHDRLGDAAVELVVEPGANAVTLILDGRGRIDGRVVDGAGTPVPLARVELDTAAKGNWSSRSTRSDLAGRFTFRWLEAGEYRLSAGAPGLRLDGPPVTVTLGDGVASPVELVLTGGEEIAGRLLGLPEAADPAQYQITAYRPREPSHGAGIGHHFTAAEAEGHFRITGLEPGAWTVSATGPNGRSASGEVEVAIGGGPYRLDLDVGGGLTLTGSVRAGGEPMAGVLVRLAASAGGTNALVTTAADGSFRAEGLEPGRYEISVDTGPSTIGRRDVVLTGDDEIHLDLATASLSGRVLDAAGEPVTGAEVRVALEGARGFEGIAGTTTTDPAGRFDFPLLTPDRYAVSAHAERRPVARVTVALEEGERRQLELRLESGSELVLVPLLAAGGRPHLVSVTVFRPGEPPVYQSTVPVTADGTAVLSDVPAGAWTAAILDETTALVAVPVEVPGPPVTVVLPPSTIVEIEAPALGTTAAVPFTIVGADGRPPAISALWITLQIHQGRAHVPSLPPGTWTVHAVGPDGREYHGAATSTPEQPARLVLE